MITIKRVTHKERAHIDEESSSIDLHEDIFGDVIGINIKTVASKVREAIKGIDICHFILGLKRGRNIRVRGSIMVNILIGLLPISSHFLPVEI